MSRRFTFYVISSFKGKHASSGLHDNSADVIIEVSKLFIKIVQLINWVDGHDIF